MDHENFDTTCELPSFALVRKWRIRICSGEHERLRSLKQGQTLLLGSSDSADVQVLDPTVSAHHCRMTAEPGGLRVVDQGSKNGTYMGPGRIENILLAAAPFSFSMGRTSVEIRPEDPSSADEDLGLVGHAPSIVRVREKIRSFAGLSQPVLILGESGTGKDVVASALHACSGRSGSYVATNMAAYPDSLIDAELFGYEKGAFTGATTRRPGLFEQANRGTLFLDEIAELSRAGQAKLLRVVEDGKVRALGTQGTRSVDVRLISATCRDLDQMMQRGEFRLDIFHRLSLLTIQLPPLRNRLNDLAPLASHFLRRISSELGTRYLSRAAVEALRNYHWPGNVRELFAVLYRAAALAPGQELGPHLFRLSSGPRAIARPKLYPQKAAELLALHENVSAAARAAGVPRSTFRSMLQRAKASG